MSLSFWEGLILGLVQGLTEFLPVSSSGHLVLAERLLGYQAKGVFLEVVVHVGTLVSVVVAYWGRIVELVRDVLKGGREGWRYVGLLVLASVPAGLAGVLLKDYFERTFHSMSALGWSFLITAAILWSTRYASKHGTGTRITVFQAGLIGIAQAIAIVPAISRSGATIAAALWAGLAAPVAAEFSFILSIIVIAGSGVLEAGSITSGAQTITPGLVAAFLAAMISGILAIRFLVMLLRSGKFHWFAPYCVVLGVLCLVWFS